MQVMVELVGSETRVSLSMPGVSDSQVKEIGMDLIETFQALGYLCEQTHNTPGLQGSAQAYQRIDSEGIVGMSVDLRGQNACDSHVIGALLAALILTLQLESCSLTLSPQSL